MTNARKDEDIKHFLDACDLVITLTSLPATASGTADQIDETRTHLGETLGHLHDFFATPLWRNEPRLLYSISRIAPHLVDLEKRYPRMLSNKFVGVLGEVAEQAKSLNHDGNWEDKIIILETTLEELKVIRQSSSTSTLTEEGPRSGGRRPSIMRGPLAHLEV